MSDRNTEMTKFGEILQIDWTSDVIKHLCANRAGGRLRICQ